MIEHIDNSLEIKDIINTTENLQSITIASAIENEEILFVGNSLVEGLRISTNTNNTFLCKVGISLEGLKENIYSRIENTEFSLVVIEMGSNELGGYSESDFKSSYTELINHIRSVNSEAPIACLSIPPVSSQKSSQGTRFNNHNVVIYNEYVKSICEENDTIFIDCKDYFGNVLNSSWTGDGMHLSGSKYSEWYDYIILRLKEI